MEASLTTTPELRSLRIEDHLFLAFDTSIVLF